MINMETYQKIQKITKPIFIIGVPRSGTTLLHTILANHPSVATFSHFDLEHIIPKNQHKKILEDWLLLKNSNKPIPANEENFLAFILYRRRFNTPKRKTPIPIEGESFWRRFFGSTFVDKIDPSKELELKNNILQFLNRKNKIRFLNKAPQNCMRLYALEKCFPDAKFICIARDPRAVISSMIKREKQEGEFATGIELKNKNIQKLDSVEKWAWIYKEITDEIYEFSTNIKKNNFALIFYENLLAYPGKTIRKLFEFCELDQSVSIKELLPKLEKTSDKWKLEIDYSNEKIILNILNESLKKINYPYTMEL
jgi:hypothetical protein